LPGARALGAEAIGEKAVLARWRLGDGSTLAIATNLGDAAVRCDVGGHLLFESLDGAAATLAAGTLPARCTVALMDLPGQDGGA
jgi:maltooligosyltrehalose trehalohydrolase